MKPGHDAPAPGELCPFVHRTSPARRERHADYPAGMVDVEQVQEFDWSAPDGEDNPAAAVRHVARAATAHEGVATLNEQAVLQLKHRGLGGASLWLARVEGEVVGFALRHGEDQVLLDLATHPDARRRGVGLSLAAAALPEGTRVEAWSHADHPGAERLALHFEVPRERELRIMRRPLRDLPPVPPAEGVRIRGFRAEDEEALVAVNAAAFAHHPEQGHMSIADFRERTGEAWFDPEGLLVAVPAGDDDLPAVLGFHWTKPHVDEDPPYGEVYVVAVNPKAAGRGLGRSLTIAGLHHLAGRGFESVLLYVDGDNEPAVALYAGLGFEIERAEAQYRGVVRPA